MMQILLLVSFRENFLLLIKTTIKIYAVEFFNQTFAGSFSGFNLVLSWNSVQLMDYKDQCLAQKEFVSESVFKGI